MKEPKSRWHITLTWKGLVFEVCLLPSPSCHPPFQFFTNSFSYLQWKYTIHSDIAVLCESCNFIVSSILSLCVPLNHSHPWQTWKDSSVFPSFTHSLPPLRHTCSITILLAAEGWLEGTPFWASQCCYHPKSELLGDARHSLPAGTVLFTSSWKDLLLGDISREWNRDHLTEFNANTCMLTSHNPLHKHGLSYIFCNHLTFNSKIFLVCLRPWTVFI